MDLSIGDPVMHWTYGLGQVVGKEERMISGEPLSYYVVKIRDLTIWVPADDNLDQRLRPPTSPARFKHLFNILTSTGEPLPTDRYERKNRLAAALKDGRAESLCRVIRDLSDYRRMKQLNENDQALMKRVRTMLLAEWGFSLEIPPQQAETDLQRMLNSEPAVE